MHTCKLQHPTGPESPSPLPPWTVSSSCAEPYLGRFEHGRGSGGKGVAGRPGCEKRGGNRVVAAAEAHPGQTGVGQGITVGSGSGPDDPENSRAIKGGVGQSARTRG